MARHTVTRVIHPLDDSEPLRYLLPGHLGGLFILMQSSIKFLRKKINNKKGGELWKGPTAY